jgi:homoserine dehydrogenase
MTEPLRVGIAGLGTVGASVVTILTSHAKEMTERCGRPIKVTAVCARDKNKDRGIDLSGAEWFDSPDELAKSDLIDVYVELIGGEEGPAETSVRQAIGAGKHVITANKALLAKHGLSLAMEAEKAGVGLHYEAAVAGGIPVIRTLRDGLVGNKVKKVFGILNGTCNYILTRMEEEGLSFEDCLKDAQRLGYAEADPTFDVDGFDTAHKLAILTSLSFGTEIDADTMYVEGIRDITLEDIEAADELGYRIKLLGVAQNTETGIEQRVHPTMVDKKSAIARISGVTNAVAIDGDYLGEIVLVGPGAGGDATASSVVGDLADVARGLKAPVLGRAASDLVPYQRARMRAHEGGYYIHLSVFDRPGAFAAIATRMAEFGISLESIVQKRHKRSKQTNGHMAQPVIMITYETTEAAVRSALEAIEKDGHVEKRPKMIRLERFES